MALVIIRSVLMFITKSEFHEMLEKIMPIIEYVECAFLL